MPATIIPFRSRNPETNLLSRRNAEEAKRLLREDGGMDFDRKGLRALGRINNGVDWILGQWFAHSTPDVLDRLCPVRKPANSSLDHGFNPSPDNGAA